MLRQYDQQFYAGELQMDRLAARMKNPRHGCMFDLVNSGRALRLYRALGLLAEEEWSGSA